MSRAHCFFCDALASMWVEVSGPYDVALCGTHYEEMIVSAEEHNPQLGPGVVRSCMERASYPVKRAGGDSAGAGT